MTLFDALPPDKDEVKTSLPLAYALYRLGVPLDANGFARCPFHADSDPSLYLWVGDDGRTRWHCQPCATGGDVFDFIQRLRGSTFGDALQEAAALLAELPPDYEPPPLAAPQRDPQLMEREVAEARQLAAQPATHGRLSLLTGIEIDDPAADPHGADQILREELGWGIGHANEAYAPHWGPDGQLTGCKIRHPDGRKWGIAGSTYPHLYLSWTSNPRGGDVLLCAGETDTAWAFIAARREGLQLHVRGLGSGEGREPQATELNDLKGVRTVTLALDPDPTGIRATRAWVDALRAIDVEVRVARLPAGHDLKDTRPRLADLLSTAARPTTQPQGIATSGDGWEVLDRDGNPVPLTNWALDPTAVLEDPHGDGGGFRVDLIARGTRRRDHILHTDLATQASLNRWAGLRGLHFHSQPRNLELVNEYVHWRGETVPTVFVTDRVGYHLPPPNSGFHDPSFVYLDSSSGTVPWSYFPGRRAPSAILLPADARNVAGQGIRLDWTWIANAAALQGPEVAHPILAWIVAAARRPEFAAFPMLFLGGSSGSGKSTLARVFLRLAGSAIETSLSSATPFVLLTKMSSSTSFPVLLDEFTRLSKKEALDAVQGVIPDIYAGSTVERGTADQSTNRYHLTAPIVFAGEDSLELDRELDRVVAVQASRAGQHHAALSAIAGQPLELFAGYLHWFLLHERASLPAVPNPAAYPSRPAYNEAVLRHGWDVLHLLVEAARSAGDPVPDLPAELAIPEQGAAGFEGYENIYESAVRELAPYELDGSPFAWPCPDGTGTYVRFGRMTALVERHLTDTKLPGGSRAAKQWFSERYRVTDLQGVSAGLGVSQKKIRATLIEGFQL